MMGGIANVVSGAGGGGSGSSLPSSIQYFNGVAVNKLGLDAAITGPTSIAVKFPVPASPGNVDGGLSTTATGLEFSDGTNTAILTTTLPDIGDNVIAAIHFETDGVRWFMRLQEVS